MGFEKLVKVSAKRIEKMSDADLNELFLVENDPDVLDVIDAEMTARGLDFEVPVKYRIFPEDVSYKGIGL